MESRTSLLSLTRRIQFGREHQILAAWYECNLQQSTLESEVPSLACNVSGADLKGTVR